MIIEAPLVPAFELLVRYAEGYEFAPEDLHVTPMQHVPWSEFKPVWDRRGSVPGH